MSEDKVYTLAEESQYILITNVPKLGLRDELLVECEKFGKVSQ
jgi:hypothetical protein